MLCHTSGTTVDIDAVSKLEGHYSSLFVGGRESFPRPVPPSPHWEVDKLLWGRRGKKRKKT